MDDISKKNEDFGKCAYKAYTEFLKYKSLTSNVESPEWERLDNQMKNAWIYTAEKIIIYYILKKQTRWSLDDDFRNQLD